MSADCQNANLAALKTTSFSGHDQLLSLRTNRLERWQKQSREMQIGGPTEAAHVQWRYRTLDGYNEDSPQSKTRAGGRAGVPGRGVGSDDRVGRTGNADDLKESKDRYVDYGFSECNQVCPSADDVTEDA